MMTDLLSVLAAVLSGGVDPSTVRLAPGIGGRGGRPTQSSATVATVVLLLPSDSLIAAS